MKLSAFDSIGPGKFSCRADERVYRACMDGCAETVSEGDGGDSATLIEGSIFGLAKAGAILYEDSYGFVQVNYFNDAAELAGEWRGVLEIAEEWQQASEEDC